jgi:hypothetical protein
MSAISVVRKPLLATSFFEVNRALFTYIARHAHFAYLLHRNQPGS